jgi:hypothetical protein
LTQSSVWFHNTEAFLVRNIHASSKLSKYLTLSTQYDPLHQILQAWLLTAVLFNQKSSLPAR